MESQDTVTIAPSVLIMMAQHAATHVDGVSHTGNIPVDVIRVLRGQPMGSGVVLDLGPNRVGIDIYLIIKPGANMREVSMAVQQDVKRSIEELVGMEVMYVNAHIEDVDFSPSEVT